MIWTLLHEKMTPEHLGYLPSFLSESDPRPAAAQINERYVYGGWSPFEGFKMTKDKGLSYPGDPTYKPLACTWLRDELILYYQHSWVAILQKDGSFEVARLD